MNKKGLGKRGCVDHNITIKITVKKNQQNGTKQFAVLMTLEKAYDRVNWKSLWNILSTCSVGRHLLKDNRSFYNEVHMNVELNDSFDVGGAVRQE